MNDNDRIELVENDEGLYDIWRRSNKGLTKWVRENRAIIDEVAKSVSSGEKRANYLKYG